ncbi:hypothetical protein M0Q97_01075 [Candidatus Dojkabacteria bacterium]|jgi:hypothetical protein|nr:hypothetical protein [Candidatus Dojkabacteria bacterium]
MDKMDINHHEANNPIAQYKKEQEGHNSLVREVKEMNKWLEQMKKYNLVVVRSNHDDFVDRWILNNDWKADPKNAMEYITYTKILLEGQAPKGIIPYIINENFGNDIKTLGRDESFRIKDWELGVHGDMGQNGTKGSLEQFRHLNTKMISAILILLLE